MATSVREISQERAAHSAAIAEALALAHLDIPTENAHRIIQRFALWCFDRGVSVGRSLPYQPTTEQAMPKKKSSPSDDRKVKELAASLAVQAMESRMWERHDIAENFAAYCVEIAECIFDIDAPEPIE